MRDNQAIHFSWKLWLITLVLNNAPELAVAQTYDNCPPTGSYTASSTYSANLNASLTALSTLSANGFSNASVGQDQDRANALALCRADVSPSRCLSCVETAVAEIVQVCPNRKQAVRWYELCMLYYSDESMDGDQTDLSGMELPNSSDATNPAQFKADRDELVSKLKARAANGSSSLKVGVGSKNSTGSGTIYALLQCVPSMSSADCDDCLTRAGQPFSTSPGQGARMLQPSCNIRYEIYSFYNETRLQEINVQVLQMPNSTSGTSDGGAGSGKGHNRSRVAVSVAVPIVVCLIFGACAAIFMIRRSRNRWQEITERRDFSSATEEISTAESLQYDFGRVSAATDGFANANKLGQGGFGAVYRGKLGNGQEIAVKRLSRGLGQGDVEFKNEVLLLARLQHRNLVRLLGFTLQGSERLLIYEFLENASLDQFIFDPIKGSQLDCQRRYKIICGIARGLLYLHEDSRLKIIHRDLKASNILLDKEMNPKIADFGMARLFGQDETQGNTSQVVGTHGYMSPEYALYGQFSMKSDVFSFGVLILEIISGQKSINNKRGGGDLLSYAWRSWREGTVEDLIDPVLHARGGSVRDMARCIHIGLLCVQESAEDRPKINSIVLMLSSSTVTLPMPSQPAFVISSRLGPGSGEDTSSEKVIKMKGDTSEGSSQNEISMTEFGPR